MYCKNCGKFIESDADFCTGCGQRVQDSEPAPAAHGETAQTTAHPGKSQKSKVPMVIAIILTAIVVIAVLAGSGDKYVDLVKNGTFDNYSNMPIGAVFDDFFYKPEWSSGKDTEGNMLVEFNGYFSYFGDNDTLATFQFAVYEESKGFEVVYAGLNGSNESMGYLEYYAILESIAENYNG